MGLVKAAVAAVVEEAPAVGCTWVYVDDEPHLEASHEMPARD